MKKMTSISLFILFAVLMASCQFPGTKIQPGDKIGDMEFTNDYEQCQAPNIHEICEGGWDALNEGTCEIPADMTKFWIGWGWQEDTQELLEASWKDSTWNLTVDNYKVDLSAFGTFDVPAPNGQPARVWNVCIINPKPGPHTAVYKYTMVNSIEHGNFYRWIKFTVLPGDATPTP